MVVNYGRKEIQKNAEFEFRKNKERKELSNDELKKRLKRSGFFFCNILKKNNATKII